jgi:hypothetical protein
MTTINFQQVYEDELTPATSEALEWQERFYDLSTEQRRLVEELVEIGYRQAVQDALDPAVLDDTASLAGEMASQLQSFARVLQSYLNQTQDDDSAGT